MNTKYFKKGKLTSLYTDCIDTLCTTQRYGDAERDTGFCITLTSSSYIKRAHCKLGSSNRAIWRRTSSSNGTWSNIRGCHKYAGFFCFYFLAIYILHTSKENGTHVHYPKVCPQYTWQNMRILNPNLCKMRCRKWLNIELRILLTRNQVTVRLYKGLHSGYAPGTTWKFFQTNTDHFLITAKHHD
jgi:hypothetical protein